MYACFLRQLCTHVVRKTVEMESLCALSSFPVFTVSDCRNRKTFKFLLEDHLVKITEAPPRPFLINLQDHAKPSTVQRTSGLIKKKTIWSIILPTGKLRGLACRKLKLNPSHFWSEGQHGPERRVVQPCYNCKRPE